MIDAGQSVLPIKKESLGVSLGVLLFSITRKRITIVMGISEQVNIEINLSTHKIKRVSEKVFHVLKGFPIGGKPYCSSLNPLTI